MLSKKAKYAIKALLALAGSPRDEPVRIPPKFLELILLGLKNHTEVSECFPTSSS